MDDCITSGKYYPYPGGDVVIAIVHEVSFEQCQLRCQNLDHDVGVCQYFTLLDFGNCILYNKDHPKNEWPCETGTCISGPRICKGK